MTFATIASLAVPQPPSNLPFGPFFGKGLRKPEFIHAAQDGKARPTGGCVVSLSISCLKWPTLMNSDPAWSPLQGRVKESTNQSGVQGWVDESANLVATHFLYMSMRMPWTTIGSIGRKGRWDRRILYTSRNRSCIGQWFLNFPRTHSTWKV